MVVFLFLVRCCSVLFFANKYAGSYCGDITDNPSKTHCEIFNNSEVVWQACSRNHSELPNGAQQGKFFSSRSLPLYLVSGSFHCITFLVTLLLWVSAFCNGERTYSDGNVGISTPLIGQEIRKEEYHGKLRTLALIFPFGILSAIYKYIGYESAMKCDSSFMKIDTYAHCFSSWSCLLSISIQGTDAW